MKKLLLLCAALLLSLTACGVSPEPEEEAEEPPAETLELGRRYEVPDYAEFSLVSITAADRVQAGMGGAYYESDDGNPYIDVVLELVNRSGGEWTCGTVLTLAAVSPEGTEYQGSLYCVESEDMTSVSALETIRPGDSVRFHAAAAVPASEESLSLRLDVNGETFACDYRNGAEIKNVLPLAIGGELKTEDGSLKFAGYEFTDDLLPSDTSRAYRHHQMEDPEKTYLAVKYVAVNLQDTEKAVDTFVNVRAVFDGETYTGFLMRESDDGRGFSYDAVAPGATARLFCLIEVPKALAEQPFTLSTLFGRQEYRFSAEP